MSSIYVHFLSITNMVPVLCTRCLQVVMLVLSSGWLLVPYKSCHNMKGTKRCHGQESFLQASDDDQVTKPYHKMCVCVIWQSNALLLWYVESNALFVYSFLEPLNIFALIIVLDVMP